MNNKEIRGFRGDYFFLSNFFKSYVEYEGIFYYCVESAFQSAKLLDKKEREDFSFMKPNIAKKMGRKVKLRDDWEQIKDQVMEDCVRSKFKRNSFLRAKLLSTDDAVLIEENDWGDTYWGVCNGRGKNKLGKILMKIREELKEEMINN